MLRPLAVQPSRLGHQDRVMTFASQTSPPPPHHPLMDQLQRNPHVMQELLDFTAFLQTKGVDPTGKNLNYMQVIKVMQDPEVKQRVQTLAKAMQEAGIQLDMSTIADLQRSLGQEPTKVDKEGMVDKVKGFFKK
ncbi:hypothetical protein DM01DRAFT_1340465 [Hesseltinella vesiculosa]|uniref:Uncharacterized protein n=1 Tax=Hesseltinella vesiculosa TaxID=101127 RepID=A0A1X2G426_9FUNG|nr:hypothetical protein DM01DRAFT_1340465 [Hesseltinella vesiculosa]